MQPALKLHKVFSLAPQVTSLEDSSKRLPLLTINSTCLVTTLALFLLVLVQILLRKNQFCQVDLHPTEDIGHLMEVRIPNGKHSLEETTTTLRLITTKELGMITSQCQLNLMAIK